VTIIVATFQIEAFCIRPQAASGQLCDFYRYSFDLISVFSDSLYFSLFFPLAVHFYAAFVAAVDIAVLFKHATYAKRG